MAKKDLAQRRKNYKLLKQAGFNSYEATNYKDLKPLKIIAIIQKRVSLNEELKHIIKGTKL